VVGNDVSILHGVTLGGTGKQGQDRHPKISDGVLLGAGATVLGNISIGKGSRVAAGSMVLRDVPPHVTVVGVPARVVGKAGGDKESKVNYGTIMDQMPTVPETQSGTSPALDAVKR
jgi:serine O-acetyltransferase